MKTQQSSKSGLARLEKALQAFEPDIHAGGGVLSGDPRKDLELALKQDAQDRFEHPASRYYSDLFWRAVILQQTLEGMKTVLAEPDALARLASFVDIFYAENPTGDLEENPYLAMNRHYPDSSLDFPKWETPSASASEDRFREKCRQEWERRLDDDIKDWHGLSRGLIRQFEEKVVALENLRSGIFATAKIIHGLGTDDPDPIMSKRKSELYLKLLGMWSHFEKGVDELKKSVGTTNLFMAANELSRSKKFPKLAMADLPFRLYCRYLDYKNQSDLAEEKEAEKRNGLPPTDLPLTRLSPRKKNIVVMRIESITENKDEDEIAALGYEDDPSAELDNRLELENLRKILDQLRPRLTPKEIELIEKRQRGAEEAYSDAERQVLGGLKRKIKHLGLS